MTDIRNINNNKRLFLPLLLLGDEQEDMIDRYLDMSDLFVAFDNDCPIAVVAIMCLSDNTVEIKNLAVDIRYQRKGIGRTMIAHIRQFYQCHKILVGTGESPATTDFYKKCGFVFSHRIPDFFTNNYDHPIIDGGVQLKDMVYFKKDFACDNNA